LGRNFKPRIKANNNTELFSDPHFSVIAFVYANLIFDVMNELKTLLGPMRLPFVLLAPCCVLLGAGAAVWRVVQVSVLPLVLIFNGHERHH
jgi:hypothetical protein